MGLRSYREGTVAVPIGKGKTVVAHPVAEEIAAAGSGELAVEVGPKEHYSRTKAHSSRMVAVRSGANAEADNYEGVELEHWMAEHWDPVRRE